MYAIVVSERTLDKERLNGNNIIAQIMNGDVRWIASAQHKEK